MAFPRRRLLAVMLLACGVFPALTVTLLSSMVADTFPTASVVFFCSLLPAMILATLVILKPTVSALSLAQGFGIFGLLASSSTIALASLLILGEGADAGTRYTVLLFNAGFAALNVAIIVLGHRESKEVFGRASVPYAAAGTIGVAILYGMTGSVAARAVNAMESAPWSEASEALRVMRPLVFHIETCAMSRAAANPPTGYPRTLREMGPEGTSCLDEKTATNRVRGLHIVYEPASPDAAGRTPSFAVRVRTKESWDQKDWASTRVFHRFASAYGDTTGVVRTAWGEAAADSRANVTDNVRVEVLRACALLAREALGRVRVAESLDEMRTAISSRAGEVSGLRGCPPKVPLEIARQIAIAESISVMPPEMQHGLDPTHRMTYTVVRDAAGLASEYIIEARPVVYGQTALRSYFARTDGPLHVTVADRAANESDPVVPRCEYGDPRLPGNSGCVVWPNADEPTVALVHDSVFRLDDTIRVSVRDPRDPRLPADSTYQHDLACGNRVLTPRVGSGGTLLMKRGSELRCPPLRYSGSPAGGLYLTVFTRDRSGATSRIERAVRLDSTGTSP
jgi:hypothetical protein